MKKTTEKLARERHIGTTTNAYCNTKPKTKNRL